MKDVKQKINDYLAAHDHLTLATVTSGGAPMAHTVAYVSEGATVYFCTDSTTRKIANITVNPSVAYTVDDPIKHWSTVKGIQMTGKASVIADRAEGGRAMGLFLAKFPQAASLPPNPNFVVVKVEPKEAFFLDYSVQFGQSEKVTY